MGPACRTWAGDAELSADELIAGVRAVLPRYMLPRVITVVPELPLTVNGKLDRAAVVAAAAATAPREGTAAPEAAGPATATLVGLFRAVLQNPSVSAATDFFDAGGDSMHAIRLVSLP